MIWCLEVMEQDRQVAAAEVVADEDEWAALWPLDRADNAFARNVGTRCHM